MNTTRLFVEKPSREERKGRAKEYGFDRGWVGYVRDFTTKARDQISWWYFKPLGFECWREGSPFAMVSNRLLLESSSPEAPWKKAHAEKELSARKSLPKPFAASVDSRLSLRSLTSSTRAFNFTFNPPPDRKSNSLSSSSDPRTSEDHGSVLSARRWRRGAHCHSTVYELCSRSPSETFD